MINFETENLFIVCYLNNSGGKFLINSLGLSDDAVFQHIDLVSQQLDNKFSQADKIKYLKTKLSEIDNIWTDLELGCEDLFGVKPEWYKEFSVDQIKTKFHKKISDLSNSGKKFFYCSTLS